VDPVLAVLVLAILVGGALQRVTGMGFGLVAGPFIVLLVGPLEGVLFVNLSGALAAILILGRVARGVDWRRYAWLATTSALVTIPAALLLRDASSAALEVTVGAVVIAAMTLAVVTARLRREGAHALRPESRWPLAVTGAASGFGSVAAGIGGPPLAVYSVLSGWDPRAFRRLVRNAMFRRVELAAREDYDALEALDRASGWDGDAWADALEELFESQGDDAIGIGPAARSSGLLTVLEPGAELPAGATTSDTGTVQAGTWWARQVLDDADGDHDWAITAVVDLAASDEAGTVVLTIVEVGRLA
jgi:hypothetical protein